MPEGYGPNITYNLPNVDHLAADPADPLSLADQVEQIEQTSNETKMLKLNLHKFTNLLLYLVHLTVVKISTILMLLLMVPQYKTYDRLVYAPARSRTSYQGDYIRGDLPIMPDPNQCGWFKSQHETWKLH